MCLIISQPRVKKRCAKPKSRPLCGAMVASVYWRCVYQWQKDPEVLTREIVRTRDSEPIAKTIWATDYGGSNPTYKAKAIGLRWAKTDNQSLCYKPSRAIWALFRRMGSRSVSWTSRGRRPASAMLFTMECLSRHWTIVRSGHCRSGKLQIELELLSNCDCIISENHIQLSASHFVGSNILYPIGGWGFSSSWWMVRFFIRSKICLWLFNRHSRALVKTFFLWNSERSARVTSFKSIDSSSPSQWVTKYIEIDIGHHL